jgi:hypothetical protein
MSFLGQTFDDVKEPVTTKEGEYKLRVLDCQTKTSSKTGGEYISVRFEILDVPVGTKDINHTMMLPTPQDDAKKKNNRLYAIQSFLKACGFDPSMDINPNEVIGSECWAIIGEKDDPEYGMQNGVKKFVVGK